MLPILNGGGGRNKFPLFKQKQKKKGGGRQVLPCLGGGGGEHQISDPRFSHFVAHRPVNNEHGQFLIPGTIFGWITYHILPPRLVEPPISCQILYLVHYDQKLFQI